MCPSGNRTRHLWSIFSCTGSHHVSHSNLAFWMFCNYDDPHDHLYKISHQKQCIVGSTWYHLLVQTVSLKFSMCCIHEGAVHMCDQSSTAYTEVTHLNDIQSTCKTSKLGQDVVQFIEMMNDFHQDYTSFFIVRILVTGQNGIAIKFRSWLCSLQVLNKTEFGQVCPSNMNFGECNYKFE